MLPGVMNMPLDFKYKKVFLKGCPRHEKYDDFWRKHPPMSPQHWAKIFSPFDALEGFDEAISNKEVLYEPRRILSEDEKDKLNRRLSTLHSLTYNGRVARINRPEVRVTYFVPCTDENSEWYGTGGQYKTINGIVRRVDFIVSHTIEIGGKAIPIDDISEIFL